MNKLYAVSVLIFIYFAGTITLRAQSVQSAAEAKKKEVADLAAALNSAYQANHKKALDLAKQKNWPVYKKGKNGEVAILQGVDELGFPIYNVEFNNILAAATTHTNVVQPGGSLGLNLNGASANMAGKLGIWDGSTVYAAHQEFAGKTITNADKSTYAFDDHSTHVAGTMVAKGVYAVAKGMAFGATTLQSYDFDNDQAEMTAASANLLLSNHSYGNFAGWSLGSDLTTWTWYGLPGDTVDYKFGYYSALTRTYDQIAYNAPKYLMVFAAGNSKATYADNLFYYDTGPAVGTSYSGYNSRTDQTLVNKGPRPATISSQTSFDNITDKNLAKNMLTVGAVYPLPYGPVSASDVVIAPFSSLGPTDDGRIKPDIVGDGMYVTSSFTESTSAYGVESGTSMATPNVCGSLYLLQEYYSQKNSGAFMLAATLKGLACHTAFDAGNPGPDYRFGWGLLDMTKAAQAITDNGTKSLITEKTLAQGQTQTYNVVASGNGLLQASISWTDPAGTPSPVGTINDRTPKLVNDLDIRVSDGSTTFSPWVLNVNTPNTNATTGDNKVDNIEQVLVANTVPGKSYTITVNHKGTLTNGSQNYSLIVTGIGGTAYCASGPSSSADSRVNNVTLNDLNNTPGAGCTTYSNFTNLAATLEQGKTYPLSVSVGTCGGNFGKIAKVFIDWNGNGVFDANELVATSGVYTANGTFTANVTVPATVVPGNLSLMRVVLSETNDPATINACGTYAKGETQDYTVKFTRATVDVGVVAINAPTVNGSCPSAGASVSVKLQNFGSTTISNIPVTVTLTSATGVVTTLNETYTGTILPLNQADFALAGTFNALASVSYTVTATTTLASDVNITNNQTIATAVINNSPTVTNASAYYCTDANLYTLTATGGPTVFWYTNIGDLIPFTFGTATTTATPPVANNYYAGINDFSGTVGPATKNVFAAGGYNQFGPSVNVTTQVPVVIQSARLYIGNPGTLTFTVTNASGIVVSTTTISVAATRTTPGAGALVDDPNDQGKVYNLNLALPVAGTYTISISYPDAATIYRNNGGVSGYPFKIGNIFSITGNTATTGTGDTTTYKGFYYYFYNMQVKSIGCASTARVTVPLSKPVITLQGVNLVSSITGPNLQWNLNGVPIAGATGPTYKPLVSGIYRVDISSPSGCTAKSEDFSFVIPATGTSAGSEISLAVFPVPAASQLNIAFTATKSEQLSMLIKNDIGQSIYAYNQQIPAGAFNTILNISKIPDGIYFMQIKVEDKTYLKRITILR